MESQTSSETCVSQLQLRECQGRGGKKITMARIPVSVLWNSLSWKWMHEKRLER